MNLLHPTRAAKPRPTLPFANPSPERQGPTSPMHLHLHLHLTPEQQARRERRLAAQQAGPGGV